ncbi:glycosyltransferase family 2 protein [Paenibacillus sp. MY03]|uniref:glycosyltransferase family 2 protein n=1 Tax=Paenibacillus sp. MY03 TaxID=302980 RepID=UPI0015C62CD0|nr:glycosyltransferase family 2 protein [Paenibacillus sp. MY03]
MNPLISIIITVCNLDKYIGECLDSLVHQEGFSDYEIVVVDDGSSDNSPDICRDYAERYPNHVRFVPLERPSQLYRAHKAGLETARGTYLQIIDGDDFVRRGYLHEVAEIIQTQAPDVIIGRYMSFTEANAYPLIDISLDRDRIDYCSTDNVLRYIQSIPNYHLAYWRYIFKRSLINGSLFESHLEEARFCPLLDAIVTFRILFSASSFALLENPFLYYRRRANSTSSAAKLQSLAHVQSFAEFLALLQEVKDFDAKKSIVISKLAQELKLVLGHSDLWASESWQQAVKILNHVRTVLSLIKEDLHEELARLQVFMEADDLNGETLATYFASERQRIVGYVEGLSPASIYILPCGRYAQDIMRWLDYSRFSNMAYLDNNTEMHGLTIQGKSCDAPAILDTLTDAQKERTVVLIATIYRDLNELLYQQCVNYGVPESNLLVC